MSRWFVDLDQDVNHCPDCGVIHTPPEQWHDDTDGDGRLDHALRARRIAPEPVGRPRTAVEESKPVLTPQSRRERVSQLLARAKSGDLSAVEALRRAIGGDDAA